jgi:hypothetical protein
MPRSGTGRVWGCRCGCVGGPGGIGGWDMNESSGTGVRADWRRAARHTRTQAHRRQIVIRLLAILVRGREASRSGSHTSAPVCAPPRTRRALVDGRPSRASRRWLVPWLLQCAWSKSPVPPDLLQPDSSHGERACSRTGRWDPVRVYHGVGQRMITTAGSSRRPSLLIHQEHDVGSERRPYLPLLRRPVGQTGDQSPRTEANN